MTTASDRTAWLPDLIYAGGRFRRDLALVCDDHGRISGLATAKDLSCDIVRLHSRAMLPGMINTHSHAFQRLIRGKTEHRSGAVKDSFWTWREMMYRAAECLGPEDIYIASRMAFLEMALGGITTVGEFHYLHKDPVGAAYDDPNLLAKEVIRAARDVGLRIALLRVAYARSGYRVNANERQKRFIEEDPDVYLGNFERLKSDLDREFDTEAVSTGLAPHSIRALPLEHLHEINQYGNQQSLKIHMHAAEQPSENDSCLAEHGLTVVALLAHENILSERFTLVHAVHITEDEAARIARANAIVCACPTTERNLGDGIVPARLLAEKGVRIAFGTDSHTQIDLLEDARQLEYNLRLTTLERNVLAPESSDVSALAARLFDGTTIHGARSIGTGGGSFEVGRPADFFTVDINDPSVAGASAQDLLSNIVFSLSRTAIRDVVVGGKAIVEDGQHHAQEEIVEGFSSLQHRLWGSI